MGRTHRPEIAEREGMRKAEGALDRLPYPTRHRLRHEAAAVAAWVALAAPLLWQTAVSAPHAFGFQLCMAVAPMLLPALLRAIHHARARGKSGRLWAGLGAFFVGSWGVATGAMFSVPIARLFQG